MDTTNWTEKLMEDYVDMLNKHFDTALTLKSVTPYVHKLFKKYVIKLAKQGNLSEMQHFVGNVMSWKINDMLVPTQENTKNQ